MLRKCSKPTSLSYDSGPTVTTRWPKSFSSVDLRWTYQLNNRYVQLVSAKQRKWGNKTFVKKRSKQCEQRAESARVRLQGDPSVQRLHFVDFDLVVLMSAWAAANQTWLAWHTGKAVELQNQSQQNKVADLTGNPVTRWNGICQEAEIKFLEVETRNYVCMKRALLTPPLAASAAFLSLKSWRLFWRERKSSFLASRTRETLQVQGHAWYASEFLPYIPIIRLIYVVFIATFVKTCSIELV